MDSKLRNQLDLLDAELNKLLEELRNYRESDLNRRPKPGAWSPLQVMQHLMRSEELSQAYVTKKLSFNPTLRNKSIASSFRSAAVNLYLSSPFKFKAPDAIGDNALPEGSSFWEVVKQWTNQRQALADFLENIPAEYRNKEVYKHPVGGRLTLDQMLEFFHAHFRRHRKQIRKALIFPPKKRPAEI